MANKPKEDWRLIKDSPHTCGCVFETVAEETLVDEASVDLVRGEDFPDPATRRQRGKAVKLRADLSGFDFEVPRRRTRLIDQSGRVREQRDHGPTEPTPPPGRRVQFRIVEACPKHKNETEPFKQQTWKSPVCGCKFRQFETYKKLALNRAAARAKGRGEPFNQDDVITDFWGACTLRVCDDHSSLPPDQIYAAVQKLTRDTAAEREAQEESDEGGSPAANPGA